jgi:hypothetical protein
MASASSVASAGQTPVPAIVRRQAKSVEESRLEAPERVNHRQQVIAQLGRIDYGFVGVWQEHEAV